MSPMPYGRPEKNNRHIDSSVRSNIFASCASKAETRRDTTTIAVIVTIPRNSLSSQENTEATATASNPMVPKHRLLLSRQMIATKTGIVLTTKVVSGDHSRASPASKRNTCAAKTHQLLSRISFISSPFTQSICDQFANLLKLLCASPAHFVKCDLG